MNFPHYSWTPHAEPLVGIRLPSTCHSARYIVSKSGGATKIILVAHQTNNHPQRTAFRTNAPISQLSKASEGLVVKKARNILKSFPPSHPPLNHVRTFDQTPSQRACATGKPNSDKMPDKSVGASMAPPGSMWPTNCGHVSPLVQNAHEALMCRYLCA